jgi:hypothetical protein
MNLMSLTQIIKYGVFLIGFSLITACGADPNGEKEDTDTTTQNEVVQSLEKVLTDIPNPSDIPYQLKSTGADFSAEIPNPYTNVEKYLITNNKAALNVGVYSTDVGYVSVYEQVQNALDYIKAVERLGDKLDITNAFDPKMQERFKGNISKVDSLTSIINEALSKSDQYLKDNDRNSIAALIFTGSFIEGLYISTQIIATYPEDLLPKDAKDQVLLGLVRIITQQDKPLEDLIKALKSLEEEEEIKGYISDLEALSAIYKELNIQEKIEKNQGQLILNDETIKGITAKVKEIRTKIVS